MIRNRLKIAWAYAEKFAETQQTGILAALFAFLTIFISCLGLFGLAGYMAENRTKEIGVRKVLGATVGGIVGLLSKDFVKLVAIAFVIASPIAYYVMDRWLGGEHLSGSGGMGGNCSHRNTDGCHCRIDC